MGLNFAQSGHPGFARKKKDKMSVLKESQQKKQEELKHNIFCNL
jgi:hypothetical protein